MKRDDVMRIISGKYKGRILEGHKIAGTRPTMDRVKESVFAMIQSDIKDSCCLDLFSGSGNLGIEAISNGARKVYFVDFNQICIETIEKNLRSLKITEEAVVLKKDYLEALRYFKARDIKFQIIFFIKIHDCLHSIKTSYNWSFIINCTSTINTII